MGQEQRLDDLPNSKKARLRMHRVRWLIALTLLVLILGGTIFWLVDPQGSLYTILPVIIFTVLSVVIGLFQWLFPVGSGAPVLQGQSATMQPALISQATSLPQIIAHMPIPEHTHPAHTGQLDKISYRGIMGIPPPTDPRTIQPREAKVHEIFTKLGEQGVTALVLTGIGGVGKSTLAALVYRYAEAQRLEGHGPFAAPALWLTIDSAVTMADLAGNLFEVFGKPLPDFANLSLQHQAMALFNVLNTSEQPRLVVFDQFENLLDMQTGHALADRPGVGEWLDAINSQPCACKMLLTSRPWPLGTREYPSTYMQEYIVKGLGAAEGADLLRKLHIDATDAELQRAVEQCQGHAFSLTLLASLLRNRHLKLSDFFHEAIYMHLWTGNVARNLLDLIYQRQLNEQQCGLLLAFSIYRKPVQLDAAIALLGEGLEAHQMQAHAAHAALDVLLNQHLLQAWGEGRYQLHAIVAGYAQAHFVEHDDAANHEAVRAAHTRAAEYYARYAQEHCPAREKREQVGDVEPFVEAVWQLCQAERWPDAYDLMEQEGLFALLKRAGGNAILLELYQNLSLDRWQPSPEQRARVSHNLGVIHRSLGHMEQALDYLEQALRIYREQGDAIGEARVLNDMGRVYGELGNHRQARSNYEVASHIFQEQGDRQDEGSVLNNLGWGFVMLGQDKEAQAYYEQALSIFQQLQDRKGEAATLNHLGRVYEDLDELEQAQSHYEQALQIFQEERGRKGEAWSLNNIGKIYRKLGKFEQSLDYLLHALTIRREIDRKGEGRTLKNLGIVYEKLGQKQQALTYYKQALLIAKEIRDREGEGKALRNIGKIYLDAQRYDAALAALLQAQFILQEIGSSYYDESERGLKTLRKTLGDDAYAILLASVEPRAAEIVEEALKSEN
jgi:tetratricopeptide (TPR) repeat protein